MASVRRQTKETEIDLTLVLDGKGEAELDCGVPFLEHMLTLWSYHACFDLQLQAKGDWQVDAHHVVEDVGLVLGETLHQALGDKAGITRYASLALPMDEALVLVAIDLSGRPYLGFDLPLPAERVGNFETELVEDFLRAFTNRAHCTLHVKLLAGRNTHHIIEALFKGLGRVLGTASRVEGRVPGIPSTKGLL
ncbi:MAG TPA: imidazoleglycerol-phosphate dehydratase HisB [Oscillospiraceae bacterium]|nr:imidazoleglycerol-phosphate dehydratase HisB [Oscillospiraceae bacterium]